MLKDNCFFNFFEELGTWLKFTGKKTFFFIIGDSATRAAGHKWGPGFATLCFHKVLLGQQSHQLGCLKFYHQHSSNKCWPRKTSALLQLLQFKPVKSGVISRSVPAGGDLFSQEGGRPGQNIRQRPAVNGGTFQLVRKRESQVHVFTITPKITFSQTRYQSCSRDRWMWTLGYLARKPGFNFTRNPKRSVCVFPISLMHNHPS